MKTKLLVVLITVAVGLTLIATGAGAFKSGEFYKPNMRVGYWPHVDGAIVKMKLHPIARHNPAIYELVGHLTEVNNNRQNYQRFEMGFIVHKELWGAHMHTFAFPTWEGTDYSENIKYTSYNGWNNTVYFQASKVNDHEMMLVIFDSEGIIFLETYHFNGEIENVEINKFNLEHEESDAPQGTYLTGSFDSVRTYASQNVVKSAQFCKRGYIKEIANRSDWKINVEKMTSKGGCGCSFSLVKNKTVINTVYKSINGD